MYRTGLDFLLSCLGLAYNRVPGGLFYPLSNPVYRLSFRRLNARQMRRFHTRPILIRGLGKIFQPTGEEISFWCKAVPRPWQERANFGRSTYRPACLGIRLKESLSSPESCR